MTIGKSLNKNLLTVEEEITKRLQAIADAQKTIKENAINIKAISEATGISRKTFYNNVLLGKFVEENNTTDITSREEIKKLKDRLADSDSKLLKVLHRDIDTEILRYQIEKLQAELENSHKRIKVLEEQHEQDLRNMNKPVITTPKNFGA